MEYTSLRTTCHPRVLFLNARVRFSFVFASERRQQLALVYIRKKMKPVSDIKGNRYF